MGFHVSIARAYNSDIRFIIRNKPDTGNTREEKKL